MDYQTTCPPGWVRVELCVDCVLAVENGPSAHEPDADWPGLLPQNEGVPFVAARDGDGEPITEPSFGTYPCFGCGSGLAGDRYPYLLLFEAVTP